MDCPVWRLTGFYGCPESERRRESWNILRNLATDVSLPWCIIGDFNDLLSNDEKRGRCDHPLWKIRGFREAIMDCQLTDLVLEGHQFTCSKGRGTNDFKERKLDRAMATHDWFEAFPNYLLCNTIIDRSDHSPIMLFLFGEGRRRRRRQFKFENSWLVEDSLEEVVVRGWGVGDGLDLVNRLRACTEEMNVWGKSLRLRFRGDIDRCKKELEVLRGDVSNEVVVRYIKINHKLSCLLAQEEAFWKQRAKVLWLKEGDSNSRFFHAFASARKCSNEILSLTRDDGTQATT